MSELLEIDFDSRYMLVCRKSLSREEMCNIMRSWEEFIKMRTPALLVINGEEFELVEREE